MQNNDRGRRRFLGRMIAVGGGLLLAGCDRLSRSEWFTGMLSGGEKLNYSLHRWLLGGDTLAQEFSETDLSPHFRSNGTASPNDQHYKTLAANRFADYRLEVAGLVEKPGTFSLAELQALPCRTQITRHDCVEGWSAIGKWKGARLSALLELVGPKPQARYVVFYCADPMNDQGDRYYESIDLVDAYHEQTILAYELNDQPLPIANGAPIRVRVERQLGYKMAKFIMRIELVESFDQIAGGHGGYWEDHSGYEWYAGI